MSRFRLSKSIRTFQPYSPLFFELRLNENPVLDPVGGMALLEKLIESSGKVIGGFCAHNGAQ
jgi:hypothetical protein